MSLPYINIRASPMLSQNELFFSSSLSPTPLSPHSKTKMAIGAWLRGPLIGRGSTAEVSMATAVPSGEVFAVKSAEISRSAALRREQSILSSLDSPHVVSCFGFDVSAEELSYNLFLEYAARGSLADDIARRGCALDEAEIRANAGDILRGLGYLHARGVVHCDLKGRNVLIGANGRAKIADLGCARRIVGDSSEFRGQMKGTPVFMAPEVARGEEQGPPADVWALGCTVVEMATGRPPWPETSDPISAIHQIAFSMDVPEIPGWLSGEGKDFLAKCLTRDPRERWTAEQLLEHEFVAASSPAKFDTEQSWISPKSTLDQAPWESLPEHDEAGNECSHADDLLIRIQQLAGNRSPNWTWDEDWVTIRSSYADGRRRGDDSFHNSCEQSAIIVDQSDSCDASREANVSKELLDEEGIQIEIWYWLFCFNLRSIVTFYPNLFASMKNGSQFLHCCGGFD